MRLAGPPQEGVVFPNGSIEGTPSVDLRDWIDAFSQSVLALSNLQIQSA